MAGKLLIFQYSSSLYNSKLHRRDCSIALSHSEPVPNAICTVCKRTFLSLPQTNMDGALSNRINASI